MKLSFRPKLAQWIAFHMFYRTEYLDEYLLDISDEPLDRNSFLLQSIIDGQSAVQYTHLHKKSKENYALVDPVNLQLKVGDSNVVVANIIPVALSWADQSWYRGDFARKVFDYMQTQLADSERTYSASSDTSALKSRSSG